MTAGDPHDSTNVSSRSEYLRRIKADEAKALQDLYRECLPAILEEDLDLAPRQAKRYLQDALIKVRDDVIHGHLVNVQGEEDLVTYTLGLVRRRVENEHDEKEIDQKIIESLQNPTSDGWAFYYMQLHYFPGVNYFVQKNGGSEEEAKDIIMDGIEALINNVRTGHYQPRDSAKLRTYFFQICRNKWYDYLDRKKRTRPVSLFADLELDRLEEDYYYEYNDELMNERQKEVANVFKQSTETCQRVLGYFYYDEMSHEEIASRMGYNGPDTSKTQKNKCLRKLKSTLSSIFSGDESDGS